jgi:uncharacterized protein YndB with AHSA1/START domain
MADTTADERDDGRLEQAGAGRWSLRFRRRLPHRPDKVWRAVTEPEHLAAWFPQTIEGERTAGARLRFEHREGEGPGFDGEMVAFDPPKVMELAWGTDHLRFELQPDGDGTVLTLTDTFDERGKAARDAAGWHACLDLLAFELNGQKPPFSSPERWKQVHGTYVERLGPEASTIGPPMDWEDANG